MSAIGGEGTTRGRSLFAYRPLISPDLETTRAVSA
jgi:hypothetical protein